MVANPLELREFYIPFCFLEFMNKYSYLLNTDTNELWSVKILCRMDHRYRIQYAWEFNSGDDCFAEYLHSKYESIENPDECPNEITVLSDLMTLINVDDTITIVDMNNCLYKLALFIPDKNIRELEEESVILYCNTNWMDESRDIDLMNYSFIDAYDSM